MTWPYINNFTEGASILQRFHPNFMEKIHLPYLLPHLYEHGVITDEEHDVLISRDRTHCEQINMLLTFIEKKDKVVLRRFVQALDDEKKHPGHQELAKMLTKAEGVIPLITIAMYS